MSEKEKQNGLIEINFVFSPEDFTSSKRKSFRSEKFLIHGSSVTIILDFFNKDKMGSIIISSACMVGSATLHFDYEFIIENQRTELTKKFTGSSCLSCAKSKLKIPINILQNEFCDEQYGYLFESKPRVHCLLIFSSRNTSRCVPSYKNRMPTRDFFVEKPNSQSSAKESTGFVGLTNQGSTCYMNSYLQSLYNLPSFRRLVFELPTTGAENAETNIPLNLQTLFFELQTSTKAVSTKRLTKSFGWTASDVFLQHDVEEFSRVLMDNLETKLKGTAFENSISSLFRGKMKTFIKCKNVDFESSREEYFYDLNLDIAPSLEKSFEKYLEKDELIGDNQYNTGDIFGKQDAEMGVEFIEMPPILSLHLKRFQLDMKTFRNVKINDRVEFPLTLDLSKYCAGCVYDLYGVLVHSGSAYGGHYYAFLRQLPDGKWNCFNDSSVYTVEDKEAIENNFGGNRSSSGYYFIYVKHDEISDVFKSISDNEIPEHIKETSKTTIENEIMDSAEGSKNVDVIAQTDNLLIENTKNNRLGFLCEAPDLSSRFQIERSTKISEFYKQISEKTSINIEKLAIWRTVSFGIPTIYIPNSDSLLSDIIPARISTLDIFAQKTTENKKIGADTINIFIKIFDPETGTITYQGSNIIEENEKLIEIIKKFGNDYEIAFEEIASSKTARALDVNSSIRDNFVSNGTIIVIQKKPTKIYEMPKDKTPSIYDIVPELRHGLYNSYVDEHYNMAIVSIKRYTDYTELSKLKVPLTIKPPFLKYAIAKLAGIKEYDPGKMGILIFASDLFICNAPSSKPLENRQNLRSMISSQGSSLFFETVEYNDRIYAGNLDSVRAFQIIISEDGVNTERHTVLMPLGSTPNDALEILKIKIESPRCYEMYFKASAFGDPIGLNDQIMRSTMPIRIEHTPEDQKEGMILKVSYGYRDIGGQIRGTGDPFMVSARGTMKDLEKDIVEKAGKRFVEGCTIESVLPIHTFGKDVQMDAKVSEVLTAFSELRIILPQIPEREKTFEKPVQYFPTVNSEKAVKIYN